MRIASLGLVLGLIGVASGGCAATDGDPEGTRAAEIGTPTPSVSAFVLTVAADENKITVSSSGSTTVNTCPAFSTCSFAYLGGTALTIRTPATNTPDCFHFVSWDGACAGQTNVCNLVITSDLFTAANFAPTAGCVPK